MTKRKYLIETLKVINLNKMDRSSWPYFPPLLKTTPASVLCPHSHVKSFVPAISQFLVLSWEPPRKTQIPNFPRSPPRPRGQSFPSLSRCAACPCSGTARLDTDCPVRSPFGHTSWVGKRADSKETGLTWILAPPLTLISFLWASDSSSVKEKYK